MSVSAIILGYYLLRLPGLPPDHVFEAFLIMMPHLLRSRFLQEGVLLFAVGFSLLRTVCVRACLSACAYASMHMQAFTCGSRRPIA